jgi:hypothetical protein
MKATLRMLIPGVAAACSGADADKAQHMREVADSLSPAAAAVVSAVIELQIFHLRRAREVIAHMRTHTAQARASAS